MTTVTATHVRGPFAWAEAASYSQAVLASGLAFLSGQYGARDDGDVVSGDFREQAEATFQNIGRVLEAAGTDLGSVIHLRVFLTDENDVGVFREVRAKYFASAPYPASTLVYVRGLVMPEMKIEVEATAVVPA